MDYIAELKDLLPDPLKIIKLHDFICKAAQTMALESSQSLFDPNGSTSKASLIERIRSYEQISESLLVAELLIGRWGQSAYVEIATIPLRRTANDIRVMGGNTTLLQMRWYPVSILLYAGCIGAVASGNYEFIYGLTHTAVPNPYGEANKDSALVASMDEMMSMNDVFALISDTHRNRPSRSDHLAELLKPYCDQALYLSTDYDQIFDRTEVIFYLEYLHLNHPKPIEPEETVYGPAGRFAWKNSYKSPLSFIISEAAVAGDDWRPIKAGLFGGSAKRFAELADAGIRSTSRFRW